MRRASLARLRGRMVLYRGSWRLEAGELVSVDDYAAIRRRVDPGAYCSGELDRVKHRAVIGELGHCREAWARGWLRDGYGYARTAGRMQRSPAYSCSRLAWCLDPVEAERARLAYWRDLYLSAAADEERRFAERVRGSAAEAARVIGILNAMIYRKDKPIASVDEMIADTIRVSREFAQAMKFDNALRELDERARTMEPIAAVATTAWV